MICNPFFAVLCYLSDIGCLLQYVQLGKYVFWLVNL
jgi:hypothetical protein